MLHVRGRKLFFLSYFLNLVNTIKGLDIHIKKKPTNMKTIIISKIF